jgi:uncharacterized protein YfaS (alpha-2-macroglobulin family)
MKRTSGRRRRAAGLLAACLLLTGCWGGGDDDDATSSTTAPASSDGGPIVSVAGATPTDGVTGQALGLRLSEGAPIRDAATLPTVVDGTPLGPDEVAAIIARLPDWVVPEDDRATFERPVGSLPPPLVGETIGAPFPPATDGAVAEPVADDELEVVRYQPEGPVDVAPFLSVTFDQPMVPLTTLGQLDAVDVPVLVTPPIEGRWRWIGTRTLRFELVPGVLDRLPASTEYLVEVPAGTRAANGARLARTVSWRFSTPTPSVTSFVGASTSLPLAPVFVAVFDQRVDPAAVLRSIGLVADGDPILVRLATDAEIDADEAARDALASALPGRAVAFRPLTTLPPDTPLRVRIGPDTPSAEGPLRSREAETFEARTFGRLAIADTHCDWGDGCVPGVPLSVELTNALDPDAFRAEQVSVEPRIPGMRINVVDRIVEISGATAGRTTYSVTFDAALRDVFGQTLGSATTVEFDVGSASPAFQGIDRPFVTTDPSAERPTVSIRTINHDEVRVRAWAVTPADLAAFRDYLDRQWSDVDAEIPEWSGVLDETIAIESAPDRYVDTAVDLGAAFNQAGSQIVVRIEPTSRPTSDDDAWRNRPTTSWVQATTLGLDALFGTDRLVIRTTDLLTGDPVRNVPVELLGDGRVATTDEDGVAELELGQDGIVGLWANAGERTALLADPWGETWQATEVDDEGRWYVFDDRGVYRPGETAHLTGWVRRFAWSGEQRLQLYDEGVSVAWTASDPQGAEIGTGTAPLDTLGGFTIDVEIPAGSNLGQAWVELRVQGVGNGPGTSSSHPFQVQEFRRPEFEVSARNESPGPFYATSPATVAVDAEYFGGGALADAQVDWLVTTNDTTYAPPGWQGWTFGVWQPWWFEGGRGGLAGDVAYEPALEEPCIDCGPNSGAEYERFTGRTGPDGSHYLRIDFDGPDVDLPTTVSAEATVFDVDRQAWSSRTDLLVHPAEYYVGLRSDRPFVERGTPLRVDAVVADVDGAAVAGRTVTMTAGRLEWTFRNGEWTAVVADESSCTITSTASATDGTMRCEFATDVGGTYRITALVTDETGHRNRSELTVWVSGGDARPSRDVTLDTVTIVPDREEYAPGDTAQLLVQAPFAPATGLVTITQLGILGTQAFDAEDGSAVVEIPVVDAHVPDITVQVDMVGSAERADDDGTPRPDLPRRPAFATGTIRLSVPPVTRALDVVATPATPEAGPGDDTSVTVSVTGPDGAPVAGAGVAIVVVDEAVLSLTGYELGDPLDVFYRDVWSALQARYLRSTIELAGTDVLGGGDGDDTTLAGAEAPAAEEAADAGGAARAAVSQQGLDAIALRTDLRPLALYAPAERTGGDGTVTVALTLPDSVTRYRVMAVAVDGAERFGTGESTITARLPLAVRPSAPRFLNYGDTLELPVVVQNQSGAPIDVDVAVQTSNLTLTGPAGLRVTVPANDRVEVRFPATTESVGTARFRVAAVSGAFADAVSGELPVFTPATAEAFASYGTLDAGAVAQPIVAPTGVFPEFGGLEIETSATALQALTDAVIYLSEYRYESSDGLASRIMAIAALRDVLDAFDAEGLPSPSELNAQVERDLAALVALQNDDGGWPSWQRGRSSIPWTSVQAAHALVLAQQAGYAVDAGTLSAALSHLAEIERHIPADYSASVRDTISAYALFVRQVAGQGDATAAAELYRRAGDELQLDALAWLWPSLIGEEARADVERRIRNAAVETAAAATFATDYAEDAYVIAESDRRVDGIVLDALLTQTPGSDLVPKVVAGLLGNRTRGRWDNVQENAFILLALHRYFTTFESAPPDFIARAWLGDLYVSEAEFRGRTTARARTVVPMTEVIQAGSSQIVVGHEGIGRLYYRLGLRYAPDDLVLDPRDEGFVVDRVYEAVDDPGDVTRDADGTWRIRAGADVRVRVTMVADARRTHVALIDPLPAGLEPINPSLAVSQTIPPPDADEQGSTWSGWWSWFEHQNLRDDRAEAFASLLPGGTYEYDYVARATTPGRFVVPPSRAEEIYAPEVFGRSASAVVVVG